MIFPDVGVGSITQHYNAAALFRLRHYYVGMFEVLGSWNKVTPHLEGGPFEGELERQLEDAMASEPETGSITIVSRDHSVKTGFSPPGP